MMLFDSRRDSLRAELAVTCTRDQTSTGHVDISATTPRFGPPLGPGTQTVHRPSILAGRLQGDESESPRA